jgi:hypothetical protein
LLYSGLRHSWQSWALQNGSLKLRKIAQ